MNSIKNLAMSTIHVVSSTTTRLPEPIIAPASFNDSKSIGESRCVSGKQPPEGPPICTALNFFFFGIPPPISNTISLTVIPIGTSIKPVFLTFPVSANIFVPEARAYSDTVAEELVSRPQPPLRCEKGLASDKNVIVLIVESLSSYQSKLFGGTENWTPELDKLGQDALIYPRMHANGFSTNEGMVGILGGVRLLSPFSHMLFRAVTPFQTAWGLEETLPRRFSQAGYHTAFLTTGPLSFASIGSWLEEIGFAEVEGGDSERYNNWRKIQFGAAPDEALYKRTLDWIAERPADKAWMLTLATVSTHQPYRDPETMQPDMEAVFRYADIQAATFIRALQDSGYFERGILLVLGDHRSMTPVSPAEEKIFGSAAPARVPLMLFGNEYSGTHPGNFQHSDFLPSFNHWLGAEHCQKQPFATLFDLDSRGRCAFHVQGAKQSLIEVFCPDSFGQVELNGDNTRFLSSYNMPAEEQQRLLGIIARQRLDGEKRHQLHMTRIKSRPGVAEEPAD